MQQNPIIHLREEIRMPNPVVAFECIICHRVFTGPDAILGALKCEGLGTPEYAFEIGDTCVGSLFGKGRNLLQITERMIAYDENLGRHVPMYKMIVVRTGAEMDGWYSEWKIKKEIEETDQSQ
jgi:hypothetical protein